MLILDANAILRYLLYDHPDMAEKVSARIGHEPIFIPVEVLAEVVYVLSGVYSVERGKIRDLLTQFIRIKGIRTVNRELIDTALKCYEEENVDFVDALLYAYHLTQGYEILTFDKKLNRLLNK